MPKAKLCNLLEKREAGNLLKVSATLSSKTEAETDTEKNDKKSKKQSTDKNKPTAKNKRAAKNKTANKTTNKAAAKNKRAAKNKSSKRKVKRKPAAASNAHQPGSENDSSIDKTAKSQAGKTAPVLTGQPLTEGGKSTDPADKSSALQITGDETSRMPLSNELLNRLKSV